MIKTQCSILSKFNSISFLHESMYKYNKNQDSPYDPTKLAIHSILSPKADPKSNCAHISKKTVSFDDIVNFIVEENILPYVDFDCGIIFNPETPTKIREINRTPNYISIFCEKPKCIRSNDQRNCFFDKQHTSNISLNRYNSWNLVLAAFVSLSHTNDRDCISNQYPQPTTHQPTKESYPVFSSLRRMDGEGNGLCVGFAFFRRKYLPDGRVNETVAKGCTVEGSLQARSNGWKYTFVMNCNCI